MCAPATIAAQHKMVSVTQAFAVDLTGQVCADQFEGHFYSGLAAQGEFLRGASRSPGGKPIICLTSTDEAATASRIRATLLPGEGVTVARSDVPHLAETAFMVHPAWQGSGLGSALQRHMAEHARRRGVRGFVAEILAGNENMIHLARAGAGVLPGGPKVSVEPGGSTLRITTLW